MPAPPEVHRVLRSNGRGLDDGTRAAMERRLGHDFSAVRIHDDADAAHSARTVNAQAYAVGRHLVFQQGRLRPDTAEGRQLLAHELVHVIQSGGGESAASASPGGELPVAPTHQPEEREAERIASGTGRQSGSTEAMHQCGRSEARRLRRVSATSAVPQPMVRRLSELNDPIGLPEAESEEELEAEQEEEKEEESMPLRRTPREHRPLDGGIAPPIVHEVLGSSGQQLDAAVRARFESRTGRDFGNVRVHADDQAARSAALVAARAYTVGNHMVFAAGEYDLGSAETGRLIAHELAHVDQQGGERSSAGVPGNLRIGAVDDPLEREAEAVAAHAARDATVASPAPTAASRGRTAGILMRYNGLEQPMDPLDDPRMHPEGAPNAKHCTAPSWCPEHFCEPYSNESYAKHQRTKMMPTLMLGIAVAVDSRVVPLWREHLTGGSSTKDLTSDFKEDFEKSKTTKATTEFLVGKLETSVKSKPPKFPSGTNALRLNMPMRMSAAISAIDDPASANRMNFNIPKEVPGNLAGAIGKDQTTCSAGAQPSPFDDERIAEIEAIARRNVAGDVNVAPKIGYTVKDTIDLCSGDCGTALEQVATVPISQFEATGISGDVPFTVDFGGNPKPFTVKGIAKPEPSKEAKPTKTKTKTTKATKTKPEKTKPKKKSATKP